MYITPQDVQKLQDIMQAFPDADSFKLMEINNNGICSYLTVTIQTTVNGYYGEFTTEVRGLESF
jgi:hypothetical protein